MSDKSVCCQMGCFTKTTPIPGEKEIHAEKNIIYYTVWIPYTQVYANGETQYKERRCLQFVSNSTLQREEVKAQIEEAITEVNRQLLENEHIVLYGTD